MTPPPARQAWIGAFRAHSARKRGPPPAKPLRGAGHLAFWGLCCHCHLWVFSVMFVSRRTLLGGLAALPAASLLPARPAAAAAPVIKLPDDVVARDAATISAVKTSRPHVALTFDDGPHPRLTPVLLDLLKVNNIRATFYLIGNRVKMWPQLAQRIALEGHEIGNHSWSHPMLSGLGAEAAMREIDATTLAIFEVTGRAPVTFRPPYGAFTRSQRLMLHEARNMPTILWDVDPQDWRRPGASVVASRIVSGARQGSIVLSHDIQTGTVQAMPAVLQGLSERGLGFTTVSELLGWPRWQSRQFRLASAQ